MENNFFKKTWEQENITFYLHFEGEYAIRQIESDNQGNYIFLSKENPLKEESMLYDQKLSDLEIDKNTSSITKVMFDKIWNLKR